MAGRTGLSCRCGAVPNQEARGAPDILAPIFSNGDVRHARQALNARGQRRRSLQDADRAIALPRTHKAELKFRPTKTVPHFECENRLPEGAHMSRPITLVLLLFVSAASPGAQSPAPLQVPYQQFRLANGLTSSSTRTRACRWSP